MTNTTNTTNTRPSHLVYLRRDVEQKWRDCDTAYELGYEAALADLRNNVPPMSEVEAQGLWGAGTGYSAGYFDAMVDATSF
jgi:hypothetical protein